MIKTIICNDAESFDKEVNKFGGEHKVFATQTHYDRKENMIDKFIAILFYRE